MATAVFFVLALVSISAAIATVTVRSPVASALCLILVMCTVAGFFALSGAVFIAALQVIVYAGAIMVLFLFVIMLLNLRKDEFGRDSHFLQKYLGFALAMLILFQTGLLVSLASKELSVGPLMAGGARAAVDYNSAGSVAETLFTRYLYPFEVTSVLLLAAIIGAVVIARKKQPKRSRGGAL